MKTFKVRLEWQHDECEEQEESFSSGGRVCLSVMKVHQRQSSPFLKGLNGTGFSSGLLTVRYMTGFVIPEGSLVKFLVSVKGKKTTTSAP